VAVPSPIRLACDLMGDYENGLRIRTEVLGREHVERSLANATALDARFMTWITENVWGDLWADETLDRHTRSMITIAILGALGRPELALHLRASVNTGVTDAELAQVLQHVAVYAGVPAANHAFAVAKHERPS
jgi:4-carboxymuconolactone decarboxylase